VVLAGGFVVVVGLLVVGHRPRRWN